MARTYTKVKHLEKEILSKKALGRTNKELGLEYGLSKRQIEGIISRYNKRKQQEVLDLPPKGRGRGQSELEYLRMENDLLRDFVRLIEGK